MATARSIETRLWRLEVEARTPAGLFFLLPGRTTAEQDERLAEAMAQGIVGRSDRVVRLPWPAGIAPPPPRWIVEGSLTLKEDEALFREMERRAERLLDEEGAEPDHRVRLLTDPQLFAIALGERISSPS